MLFFGEYEVNITVGGRVVIPKKIREALGKTKSFTLTKGFDPCLSGFRNEDWEKSAYELMGASLLEMKKIEIKRHLFSSAALLEMDDQGRVVIPRNLLMYANLVNKTETVFIGVGTYFEIWAKDNWETYKKEIEKNIKKYQSQS
jgi:MraZ protein